MLSVNYVNMMNISFDFWGTLCESNPNFKQQQLILAQDLFKNITIDEIKSNYKRCKSLSDTVVEEYGVHLDRTLMLSKIFDTHDFNLIDTYITESNKLFLDNPPFVINDISDIVQKHNCFVTSNTVLVYGDILSQIVYNNFGLSPKNMIFSDKVNVSKPSVKIFLSHGVKLDYHLGDNLITDGSCEKIGINFMYLDKNNNENLSILRK